MKSMLPHGYVSRAVIERELAHCLSKKGSGRRTALMTKLIRELADRIEEGANGAAAPHGERARARDDEAEADADRECRALQTLRRRGAARRSSWHCRLRSEVRMTTRDRRARVPCSSVKPGRPTAQLDPVAPDSAVQAGEVQGKQVTAVLAGLDVHAG